MIRHNEPGISVRISDEGLNQAYGNSEIMQYLKCTEQLHKIVAVVASWGFACGLGFVIVWSAVGGN